MEEMGRERRRHFREKMVAEVWYKSEKNQSFGGCVTKNISEKGVCVQIREFFQVGTILDLQFKLPLSQTFFFVKGKVVRVNQMPYNELWELGLEVLTDANYEELVKQYITLNNPTKYFGER